MKHSRAIPLAVALTSAIAAVAVLLLTVNEPEPRYRFYIPFAAQPAPFFGPGIAGAASNSHKAEIGVIWNYSWFECNGTQNCLPMIRVGCGWCQENAPDTVAALMATCGARPCLGLMILNEPEWQDQCDAACQAQQLHDHAPQALAANPSAVVVFGNYVTATVAVLDNLGAAWATRYPGTNLGQFMRDYHVRIGIHHYAWAGYNSETWRADLLAFRAAVHTCWGVDIVLSEYGALDSGDRWKQVVADQARWLNEQGILAAPFVAGTSDEWGCCAMWDNAGLNQYGQLYQAQIEHWDW